MPIETCDLGKSHQPPGRVLWNGYWHHLSFHAGSKLAAAAVKPKDPPQLKDAKGMTYAIIYIYIYIIYIYRHIRLYPH